MQPWTTTSLLGRVIGGYRLDSLIGSGGAGAVFLGGRVDGAASPETQAAQAAIKVLIPPATLGHTDQLEFRARFRREAEALRALDHPHILKVLDSGEDAELGLAYMVMPFISGGALAARMAHGPLPLAEASQLFAQLASALDYAHGRLIIHRDIKPANILLDRDGQIYLADFGLVKLFDTNRTTLTTTGQVMGTPDYMSPEQARGEQVGPAADIYSAGVVLYQMVTGRAPFEAKSLTDMLIQIVQSPPPPARQFRPELPAPAETAILQALAKKPDERFASAGRLSDAFRLGLAGTWAPDVRLGATPTVNVALPATIATPPSATYAGLNVYAGAPLAAQPLAGQPATAPVTPFTTPRGKGAPGGGVAIPAPRPAPRPRRVALVVVSALVVVALIGAGIYIIPGILSGGGGKGPGKSSGPGGPTYTGVSNQHFEIGTDFPISGPNTGVGLPTQYGVDLAVSQNSDLGHGNTLSVTHMDDGSASGTNPSQGAQNISALAADPKVIAVVGPFNSGVAIAEIPVANTDGLTLISPTNNNPGLTLSGYAGVEKIDFAKLHPGGKDYYFRIPRMTSRRAKLTHRSPWARRSMRGPRSSFTTRQPMGRSWPRHSVTPSPQRAGRLRALRRSRRRRWVIRAR